MEAVLADIWGIPGNAFCAVSPAACGMSIHTASAPSSETVRDAGNVDVRDPGNVGEWGKAARVARRGRVGIDDDLTRSPGRSGTRGMEHRDPVRGGRLTRNGPGSWTRGLVDSQVDRWELEGPGDSPGRDPPRWRERAKAMDGEETGPAPTDDRVRAEA